MRARVSALCAVATALAIAAGPASAELAPHAALYSMRLAHVAEGTRLAGAEGAMHYRFAETCRTWTVATKVYLRLRYDEMAGDALVESTWSFASTEAKDGGSYSFEVRHARDGQVWERLAGTAERTPGEGGIAVFERPRGKVVALPPGTLFPTDHLARLLDAAARGEPRFARLLFDGASLNNPYEVNAVTAGRVELATAAVRAARVSAGGGPAGPHPALPVRSRDGLAKARAAGLADMPAWWMRLAFFPRGGQGPRAVPAVAPEFEIEVDYRADGVAERIVQDFGDFALALEPVRIERLPAPDAC